MRDRHAWSFSTAPALRRLEAVGAADAVDLDARDGARDRQGQQGADRAARRPAVESVRRYLAMGRPHLDRRHRPDLFSMPAAARSRARGAF